MFVATFVAPSYEARSNLGHASGFLRCTRTTPTSEAEGGACATSALDLEARSYETYDRVGNLIAGDDKLYAVGDPRHEDLRYQFDALGRLVSAGTPAQRQQFAFDPLGNLIQNGNVAIHHDDAVHPNRITSVRTGAGVESTVEYDENGRRVTDGDRSFVYDDYDRLSRVLLAGDPISEYGYMDTGERVFRRDVATGKLTFELGDGVRLDGNELERTVFFAGSPVSVERREIGSEARRHLDASQTPLASGLRRDIPSGLSRVFLHHDHQKSVRIVTDEFGNALEYHRYRAFGARRVRLDGSGRPLEESSIPFAYTGHMEERDENLLFFGARYYDPATGSFLTLDPGMQFASPYAYSGGNPVIGRDADGTIFELSAIEIVALLSATATFIDSIVETGDLGHSLTAGVFAGFSVVASGQLSTAIARPLAQAGHVYLQMAASVATDGVSGSEGIDTPPNRYSRPEESVAAAIR